MFSAKESYKDKITFIKLVDMPATIGKAIRRGLYRIGKDHIVYCKRLMMKPKSGRVYRIRGKLHKASAAGEAPAILSGALARNVDFSVSNRDLTFGDKSQRGKAPIGLFLEEGTKKMSPRPHISQTVKDKHLMVENIISRAIRGVQ